MKQYGSNSTQELSAFLIRSVNTEICFCGEDEAHHLWGQKCPVLLGWVIQEDRIENQVMGQRKNQIPIKLKQTETERGRSQNKKKTG